MKKGSIVFLLFLALGLMFSSCDMRQVQEPLQGANTLGAERSSLSNSAGLAKSVFSPYETVFLSQDGLWASWETAIEVVRLSDKKIIRRLVVVTDGDGKLSNLPIWYNVGADKWGNINPIELGSFMIHLQQAHAQKPWLIYNIPFSVRQGQGTEPMVWATQADGSFAHASAIAGGKIYVKGANFVPGSQVKICIVPDKQTFNPGDALQDQTEACELVTIPGDGSLPNTLAWVNALAGSFDIVADAAPFAEFGGVDAASSMQIAGLVVQSNAIPVDIIADIACDAFGFHGNTYTCKDLIYAQVTPLQKPMNPSEFAALYVLFHKNQWNAGDRLIKIETVNGTEMPINCLVNPWSGSLALTLLRGQTTDADGNPVRLWPGNYDIILDINRNSLYDPGTDILDGGPQIGFTITCESSNAAPKLIVGADCDFLDQKMTKTMIHALVLDQNNNPLPNIKITFTLLKPLCRITPAAQSTNANGELDALVWDIGRWGQFITIKVEAVVNGVTLVEYCTICKEVPFVHNAGIIIGR